ncbi:MraY family glycosyltransferase [Glacieibacterium megasporae]|uniref:MraY family glycosyltransferase n=1 Tax=Glacieibacterium megasporae TaxID=2835787 RepID=UPI001C1E709A|nr:MraY family glycosyltransferase [Polymorphobacter megasporae]UAJ08850.1 undecaprenyl/decaprenyl-phosphate alpha-N-acetylglucosaminyl 1-phosphate transferase [Polymorphobacter megasporae]
MLAELISALLAALATFVACSFALPLGTSLGLLDFPDDAGGRKQHARVTPLVGGLVIAGISLGAIIAILTLPADLGPTVERHVAWLGIAVAAMFVIGVADDRFELSVRSRLGVGAMVLLLVIVTAPDFAISFVRFSLQPAVRILGLTSIPFTLLCLVGLLNAVNMADGKNGIVISLGLVWSAMLLRWLPPVMAPVMAATAGALAILLWFNMRNRLFLGDGGSYALSALFGLLAIYAYNHHFNDIGADDIILLFAVPVLDTVRLLIFRVWQRRSPFHGGRDHLHHYLYARVGWPYGLGVYITLVIVPNAAATLFPGTAGLWLGVTSIAYAVILGLAHRQSPRLA